MEARQTVETALRVLKCWTAGEEPAAADVPFLHEHALPDEADLELDDLACAIVARECRLVIAVSAAERKMLRRA